MLLHTYIRIIKYYYYGLQFLIQCMYEYFKYPDIYLINLAVVTMINNNKNK